MNRRGFLRAVAATLITAPAIVRASSLMAISAELPILEDFKMFAHPIPMSLAEELAEITRRAFVPRVFVQIYQSSPILAHMEDGQ